MPKYRKKPVEVEAWQFDAKEPMPEWLKTAIEAGDVFVYREDGEATITQISIGTLEGTMLAKPGDWIIQGVAGEIYPCRHDIFARTYEAAE
jgi:hypothetical protein